MKKITMYILPAVLIIAGLIGYVISFNMLQEREAAKHPSVSVNVNETK
jgi:hypothetical protein